MTTTTTTEERLQRLEDALIDLTVIITEGQLFRLERYVGIGCAEASSRLMKTLQAIRTPEHDDSRTTEG